MEQAPLHTTHQGSEGVIRIGPRLTIETVSDCAQQLRQLLAENDTVVMEFESEIEMDITALQLICSASTTAAGEDKRLVCREPLPVCLTDLAISAGVQCRDRCGKHPQPCFLALTGGDAWQS
jgi:anti-anti-sigma regulatory factor